MAETESAAGAAEQQLEQVYNRALELEKSGHFAEAAVFYRRALELDAADCIGAAVRLAAMGEGRAPKTAPAAYVATLFDQYADVFDLILVDSLGYNVPELLREAVEAQYSGREFRNMLDLGCGTGLVAEAFADCEAMAKTGLDLSENMVALAHERELYAHLYVGDIISFLRRAAGEKGAPAPAAGQSRPAAKAAAPETAAAEPAQESWDLVFAADVLPYMGDLADFFRLTAKVMEPKGVFGFSSENLARTKLAEARAAAADTAAPANGAPVLAAAQQKQAEAANYAVGPHQRFAHSPAYIRTMLAQAGFKPVYHRDIIVRHEQGAPVYGELLLAEKL